MAAPGGQDDLYACAMCFAQSFIVARGYLVIGIGESAVNINGDQLDGMLCHTSFYVKAGGFAANERESNTAGGGCATRAS